MHSTVRHKCIFILYAKPGTVGGGGGAGPLLQPSVPTPIGRACGWARRTMMACARNPHAYHGSTKSTSEAHR